ncbi:MAG TPA: CDGSH iron-sulfur domain-containing protein [Gemmatimonadaceae bacterium]|jgi:CDGSH-type Zn-finger protein|nr:CDGSH iron-sulfur domain-containing protein [Gemmatimonadaceae bacterium]HTA72954.1 CDGSH iron-sulfur domain-containing protein [Gemmatimonadaceae bacterium]HXB24258.1 CDGSH iron-sulfur domain-containing protein [Gemmatimonadaceae bacterium]
MIRIKVSENGPYRISAEDADQVVVVDEAGNVIPSPRPDKKAIALCRCGASMKKPYCDGTHKTLWPLTPAPAPRE